MLKVKSFLRFLQQTVRTDMKNRELLFSVTRKDFDVTWFSGTGGGGQYRNKHQNCCRIIHKESGAIGTGQSQRERPANQKEAFNNCVNSDIFQNWLRLKTAEALTGQSLGDLVDEALQEKNLKVEYRENGKWIEEEN